MLEEEGEKSWPTAGLHSAALSVAALWRQMTSSLVLVWGMFLALLLNSGKEVQTSLFMSTAGESGGAPASLYGRCVSKSTHSFYRAAQVV